MQLVQALMFRTKNAKKIEALFLRNLRWNTKCIVGVSCEPTIHEDFNQKLNQLAYKTDPMQFNPR